MGLRAALACAAFACYSVAVLVHFRLERGEWAHSISQAVIRQAGSGAADTGGARRYAFFMTGNACVCALMAASEVSLLRRCKVVPASSDRAAVFRDHGSVLLPFVALVALTVMGNIVGGQDFHGLSAAAFPHVRGRIEPPLYAWRERAGIARGGRLASSLISAACTCCVGTIAAMTLKRAWCRARCTAAASTPHVRPWLLKWTGAAVVISIALFNHADVPASFGLHVSLTIVAASAALVYLDVRGLRTRRCAAALLSIFVFFPLCGWLEAPWGSLAEVLAFSGFFACYAMHVDDVRSIWSMRGASGAGPGGLPFHLLDVFTTGAPSSGNQLLVVEDLADSLSSESMLAIAQEINFAESAFVRAHGVRIFTIDQEVQQAGHPVLGLAEVVGREGSDQVTLQTQKGPITVRRGNATGQWTASQDPPEWRGTVRKAEVAPLLRSGAEGLVGSSFPIGSTCGLPYALVSISSPEALQAISLGTDAPTSWDTSCWLYFYCRTSEHSVRTRMFCFEGGGWVEDVATGSAAGPLAAHLAPIDAVFTQGSRRLARIHVSAAAREGERVAVGGSVVRVAQGRWASTAA